MKKLAAILLILIATKTFAEFVVDVDRAQVLKDIQSITLNDLGVGESGFIELWDGLCKLQKGKIGLDKYIELESERSEYVTYLKLTRIQNSRVVIEIPPQEKKVIGGLKLPTGSGRVETLGSIAKLMAKLDTCEGEVFLVDSIEGTNSLSDLLKLITNSSVASVTSEKSPTEATAPEMSDPVWTWIVTEDKSKIDDSTNVTLMLFANEEVYNSFGSADRPTLVIRCKENTTEAYVMTGNMLDNENAIIRLDSEKAYPLKMSKSTDGKALFFPSVITNIKKFWNYETMVFRFTPYNSGSSTVTFNIGGLKTEIARLRKACQW